MHVVIYFYKKKNQTSTYTRTNAFYTIKKQYQWKLPTKRKSIGETDKIPMPNGRKTVNWQTTEIRRKIVSNYRFNINGQQFF